MSEQKQKKKTWDILRRIFKWIGLSILILLILLALVVEAPKKMVILLLIILSAFTALPRLVRKWFWLSVGAVLLILIIWVFLPEDNEDWRPYSFDEEIANLQAKYAIPDEENAALTYYEIFDNLNLDTNLPDFFTDSNNSSLDKPWFSKEHPEMKEWLDGYQDIIQKLIQNSQNQKCRFLLSLYDPDSDQKFMETLLKIRFSEYLLISAANNDIAEGRIYPALEKYSCLFRIANHLYQQPGFVLVLVHCSIKEKTLKPLNHFIIENNPNSDQLRLTENLLNNVKNNWKSDWHDMLNFDELKAKNYFASVFYEVNMKGKVRYSRRPFFENEQSSQNDISSTYWSGIFGKIRVILRWLCSPPSPKKIAGIVDAVFEEQYTMAEPDFDWDKVNNFYTTWKLNCRAVVRTYLYNNEPTYKNIHEVYFNYLTKCRCTRLLIAIRQYKDKHGSWPESLDSIKSDAPTEAFIDPVTGNQLQYENHGESFSLYGETTKIWPE